MDRGIMNMKKLLVLLILASLVLTISVSAAGSDKSTIGDQNAVKKAQNYLKYMPFSKEGLVNQLEYEGFSSKEAEFGVNHIDVDWNEQAAKKAESYLKYMAFSRSGLINQLVYDKFTQQQAEYGVSAVGY